MEPENNHNELIAKYLSGKMDPREKKAFKAEMAEDENLRRHVNEAAGIYLGLSAIEASDAGHIDIDLLVKYEENLSELSSGELREIESHIKECSECSEELELCRLVHAREYQPITDSDESLINKLRRFFFTPAFRFQPAYGIIALIILAIPTFFAIRGHYGPRIQTATYQIESGVRDHLGERKNIILIGKEKSIIRLTFSPPLITENCQTCLYDFELYDPAGTLRLVSKSNYHKKLFAFELTSDYFPVEQFYTLRVFEITEDGAREEIGSYSILTNFHE